MMHGLLITLLLVLALALALAAWDKRGCALIVLPQSR
jgi:hypothetical protein